MTEERAEYIVKSEPEGMRFRPIVRIKVLDDFLHEIGLPNRGSDGAAGLDVRACIRTARVLLPGESAMIPTGFAMSIAPDEPCDGGYAAFLLPRSGLGHKQGLVLGNLVGLIDQDYRGQVQVSAWNRGQQPIEILSGMKIAQMVVMPVAIPLLILSDELEETERGAGGFGSTG